MTNITQKTDINQQLADLSLHHEQAAAIKKMWHIFAVGSDSVLELRALWPKGVGDTKPAKVKHFRATDYTSVEALKMAFEQLALALNQEGYNVYTLLNPAKADFVGMKAATDEDIRYRDLLLVDIDRVGDTSCPASQAELDAAKALADQIREYLAGQGWPKPFVVMSGNGFHLYYVLAGLENTTEAEAEVATTLLSLAAAFDNPVVGVDTTVYNASRITKVPGTVMRKGIATEERPYRMAEVQDEE